MFNSIELQKPGDYFLPLRSRERKGIYFYRINGCNDEIIDFIGQYYNAAVRSGTVIEGRLPNPDNKNLAYYNEMMGPQFSLDKGFISKSLKKWLPRMSAYQNDAVSTAIFDTLSDLKSKGKNDNMLKNAYIKFMCWLYYKFERIIVRLGNDEVPKLLYEGSVSNYELLMIRILAGSGCDVVLLQYEGDVTYLTLDPQSEFSEELKLPGMAVFPKDFSLKKLRDMLAEKENQARMYGPAPSIINCTNAWIKGKGLDDIRTPVTSRGDDPKLFYNCFIRLNGVEDKITYLNDLFRMQQEIRGGGRRLVIVDEQIPQPSFEEIGKIRKGNYAKLEQLVRDMDTNISYPQDPELQKLMSKAFTDVMVDLSKEKENSMNRLTNKAVYLICWLKRYMTALFKNWKMPDVACFIYMGGCRNDNEAAFLKMLTKLPVDVLILVPDKNKKCVLEDKLLYELTYNDSMTVARYPQDAAALRVGTVAYHAEKELDKVMYQDSGMYRNQQYGRADALVLSTMYEEIDILWREEPKYRPNFDVVNDVVTIPVICSKISGVKDSDTENYWISIKRLFTSDTVVFDHLPIIEPGAPNPIKQAAGEFFRNGRLQKEIIKRHKLYRYGVLREEIQDHILDKLQTMINERFIRGTFENGMEYTIVATVLNLDKTIIRLIQKFDFTKVNPKVICLSLDEHSMSVEDTIFITFLSLIGFDVAVFVPTGYRTVEQFFNPGKEIFVEHQIGEYLYDLRVPNFSRVSDKPVTKKSWRDKLFKRG